MHAAEVAERVEEARTGRGPYNDADDRRITETTYLDCFGILNAVGTTSVRPL